MPFGMALLLSIQTGDKDMGWEDGWVCSNGHSNPDTADNCIICGA